MFRAFMELDSINEAYSRPMLIHNIKKAGRNYNFDKYTDAQLYRIWLRLRSSAEEEQQQAFKDYHNSKVNPTCDECGRRLTDGGHCPVCDDGEEDYYDELAEAAVKKDKLEYIISHTDFPNPEYKDFYYYDEGTAWYTLATLKYIRRVYPDYVFSSLEEAEAVAQTICQEMQEYVYIISLENNDRDYDLVKEFAYDLDI